MFGKPSNPYDEIIGIFLSLSPRPFLIAPTFSSLNQSLRVCVCSAKATDEKQTEMNWEVALTVWDKVNEDGETGFAHLPFSLSSLLPSKIDELIAF